jgi:hypothetical protein
MIIVGIRRQAIESLEERLARKTNGLRNGRFFYIAIPLPANLIPVHPIGDLLEDLLNKDTSAAERHGPVADFRVHHDVSTEYFPHHISSVTG